MSTPESREYSPFNLPLPEVNLYDEYLPGDRVLFPLCTVDRSGNTIHTANISIIIENVMGGGFFGRVLIPKDENFVIKTSLPDPWHHLWRIINWDFTDLPTRVDESKVKLGHLATKLIHDVLPVVSQGRFYSPDSYGYTKLATGYASVMEKIEGRGPRFDLPKDEYEQFRLAQRELTEIGFGLGLEHVGQIHPDNPFAMANLWYDEPNKKWLWLDTTPAILHTGWVWPFFYFKFHNDIRKEFHEDKPTFNRIHTDRFRETINRLRNYFETEQYEKIMGDLSLYEKLLFEKEKITQGNSKKNYGAAASAFGETGKDIFTERFIYKFLADPSFRREKLQTLIRIAKDPIFRVFWVNKNFILSGIERARKEGIITEVELQNAWREVATVEQITPDSPKNRKFYTSLQLYYIVTGQIINAIEASSYLSAIFSENPVANISLGVFMGWVFPSIFRPSTTLLIGKLNNADLRAAATVSAIPKLGSYTGVIAQIAVDGGSKTKQVWHYTVRNIIAALSKIKPEGGWGTQLEAELWNKLGKRLETLGKPPIK